MLKWEKREFGIRNWAEVIAGLVENHRGRKRNSDFCTGLKISNNEILQEIFIFKLKAKEEKKKNKPMLANHFLFLY